jgi:ketosteroid isomerase-like protein
MGASLGSGYEALERGDGGPLLELIGPRCEWVDPDGRAASGPEAAREALAAGRYALEDVVEAGDRCIASGVLRSGELELPFAHIWELEDGEAVRVRSYFDRSRLTAAAQRRQLAEAADELLDQAAEIRRQWARLGDALRAAGLEEAAQEAPATSGRTSARLAAVDMASEGGSREEVERMLRNELGVEDPGPILDEVFAPEAEDDQDRQPGVDSPRFTRLFARDRG